MESLKLKEFKRLVKSAPQMNLLAQETKEGKYSLIAIDTTRNPTVAFYVRHARINEQRTWRLDRLIQMLKAEGVFSVKVQIAHKPDSN